MHYSLVQPLSTMVLWNPGVPPEFNRGFLRDEQRPLSLMIFLAICRGAFKLMTTNVRSILPNIHQ